MLRTRDIVAVLLAVILARIAWTSGPADDASLSAGMRLAFYAKATLASPFDVDGDGILEALVVVVDTAATDQQQKGDWELQVLDLKPLAASTLPFEPPILFKTRVDKQRPTTVPVKLTTSQIIWNHHYHHRHHHSLHAHKKDTTQNEDRSRHYFCGTDWHDAAANCRQHCPTGSSGDCPEGETCYADTPCDALRKKHDETETPQGYTLTPAGSLPAVMTYWTDGILTVHTLSSTTKNEPLELQLLWETDVGVNLEEVHIDLLPSEDVRTDSHLGQHGMVLIGGTYENDEIVSVMHAYDAMTGLHMWSTPKPDERRNDEPIMFDVRGAKSAARRRSHIVRVQEHTEHTELPNCLVAFKSLTKGGLPHSYWTPADASVTPLHFHRHKHQRHHSRKHAVHGRPNVLLSHYRDGIHVRSLLNGRALCHLSLLEEVVYADLNQDGVLDHIHVTTHFQDAFEDEEINDDLATQENRWIAKLAHQIKEESSKKNRNVPRSDRLCHVLVLSGLPTREQIFSANVCGNRIAHDRGDHSSIELMEAPPLVVEDTHVVVALNNGVVSRYHVPTGKRLFQKQLSARVTDVPTWGDDLTAVSLSVLESRKGRALLLAGDNAMVLMSLRSGKVLAEASFPQTSLDRPIVADVSGDGTPDVIIRSIDAIWGYHVVVQSGASTLFRIIVGLLLMGIALALLRNKFGQKGYKRSTDA